MPDPMPCERSHNRILRSAVVSRWRCGSVTHFTRGSRLLNWLRKKSLLATSGCFIVLCVNWIAARLAVIALGSVRKYSTAFLFVWQHARAPIASTPWNRLCWFLGCSPPSRAAGRIGSGRLSTRTFGRPLPRIENEQDLTHWRCRVHR
jgi:hypothetical protein